MKDSDYKIYASELSTNCIVPKTLRFGSIIEREALYICFYNIRAKMLHSRRRDAKQRFV
jgi:hypothetical protein